MRSASHSLVLAAILAACGGVACAAALAQTTPGSGSSGTGTVGPATTVTAGTGTSTTVATGPPKGTPAEQTHPTIRPAIGGTHTRFAVRVTIADTLGHHGVVASDYRLQLTAPAKNHALRCDPQTLPANIESGTPGERLQIPLTSPRSGWCTGRYRLTIFLERGPYCPAPTAGRPPPPCPEFATQELDVGDTHFTITTSRDSDRLAAPRRDTT